MSPRTRQQWGGALAALAVALLGGCGEPPQPLPSSPPYPATSALPVESSSPLGGALPVPTLPTMTTNPAYPGDPALPTFTGYPTPGVTTTPTTTAPVTKSPTPTPSHAAKCAGEPTGAQILALITGRPGLPSEALRIVDGPLCSGKWSFSVVEVAGQNEDQVEPLMVIATGKGATLTLVAAGQDVCNAQVQRDAPAGVRVLACGL